MSRDFFATDFFATMVATCRETRKQAATVLGKSKAKPLPLPLPLRLAEL
jgi:hypothetical protein